MVVSDRSTNAINIDYLYCILFQAVHDPFEEINHRMLSEEFIDPIIYQQLQSSVQVGPKFSIM